MRPMLLCLYAAASACAQGFTPEEAVKRMHLPPGFSAKAVATEPMIRQPLSMSFDERGRLWVLQYLQYPNPAGLVAVKQDQYLRTVWDRVPEPPPKGPKGVDRITICYEPDAEGRFTKSKDFVTGLNLASGFCIGGGGVYVVQPPYLLFYPDKDRDDVPDADPEVLLTGFGMEDSHSYANSLQWGPDGWLYGAHGSTVTAKIKNPANPAEVLEFQQGVWRYHPKSRRFELFAEGGGNTFGLDFDKVGRCIGGTNFGGFAMLHYMQGGYYVKGFSKHGPLHNAHTYGYFDHVPYENFKGGHVTCGGVVYQADAYPKEYHDQYIAGNLLSNAVYWHQMSEKGASFTAKHGGDLLVSNDTWFRPVDCLLGPDGCIYVADWYDKRAAHLDPVDNWDKTNGRIYRIDYQGVKRPEPFDLRTKTALELVELLKHPNKWWRNEARRLLAEKPDPAVVPALQAMLVDGNGVSALEALWALHAVDALTDKLLVQAMSHRNEHVRAWGVRFLGDRQPQRAMLPALQAVLDELAIERSTTWAKDSPWVRSQLYCTVKRLGRAHALAILHSMFKGGTDFSDPHLSLLAWWALEHHLARMDAAERSAFARNHDFWYTRGMWHLLPNAARRLTAVGVEAWVAGGRKGSPDFDWIESAFHHSRGALVDDTTKARALEGVDRALRGERFKASDTFMSEVVNGPLGASSLKIHRHLNARVGGEKALEGIHSRLWWSKDLSDSERLDDIRFLRELRDPTSLRVLLKTWKEATSAEVRSAALTAAQAYNDPALDAELLETWPKLANPTRQQVLLSLLAKRDTALGVLKQVDAKSVDPKSIPTEHLRALAALKDAPIDALVLKHWGKVGPATAGEKLARIAWLKNELGRGSGDAAKGKTLFDKHCAACHTLFGEGGKVGPDLTTADRKNRDYLLTHIVDPSLYVRPEFMSYGVTTHDNRRLSGLVAESNDTGVTLVNVIDNKPVKTVVAKRDIDEMLPSAVSLMPDKMLDTLSYQEIRDLFAHLQSEQKKEGGEKLRVLLVSGSLEYKSDESLAVFQKHLEANFPVECHRAFRKADDDLPGLEALETCDVAVFFTRRLTIKGEPLERIKKYAAAGKPIVAIRTASHGFQNWLEMDKEILGGDYKNHYGAGPKVELTIKDDRHPVMAGVKGFASEGSLYKNPAVAKDVTVLMHGSFDKNREPVTWVREKNGRVFYTSLGHPSDFKEESFRKMLVNAIFWAADAKVPAK